MHGCLIVESVNRTTLENMILIEKLVRNLSGACLEYIAGSSVLARSTGSRFFLFHVALARSFHGYDDDCVVEEESVENTAVWTVLLCSMNKSWLLVLSVSGRSSSCNISLKGHMKIYQQKDRTVNR
mmetsp:Transcript_19437/g.53465  ORF Transcript_19437/g.53465 Transcript_19437/m.53465 type:complete len:126 (+) Transcript_19437:871-1248(+)